MPYASGEWGPEAKARSKRRKEYFREYMRRKMAERNPSGLGWHYNLDIDLSSLLEKADYKCEICGGVGRMVIHHINEDPSDNRLENLQYLCRGCHNTIHKKGRPIGGRKA